LGVVAEAAAAAVAVEIAWVLFLFH